MLCIVGDGGAGVHKAPCGRTRRAGHVPLALAPDRAAGARNRHGGDIDRPDGAAYGPQGVQAHPLLWSAGDQDVCHGEGGDASGSSEGGEHGQGCGADHRPLNLSAAVRAKDGTGPVGLSALSE
jgi:hypothetical protein